MARSRRSVDAAAEAALARAPITDRVNVEPPILHGMTATEAKVIASVAFILFLLIGGTLSATTGRWQIVLLTAMFGPMIALWYVSKYLARIKRGRPDGYYTQAIHLWMVRHGLSQPKFTMYSGWWSLGRTLGVSLASPLDPPPEQFPEQPQPEQPEGANDE